MYMLHLQLLLSCTCCPLWSVLRDTPLQVSPRILCCNGLNLVICFSNIFLVGASDYVVCAAPTPYVLTIGLFVCQDKIWTNLFRHCKLKVLSYVYMWSMLASACGALNKLLDAWNSGRHIYACQLAVGSFNPLGMAVRCWQPYLCSKSWFQFQRYLNLVTGAFFEAIDDCRQIPGVCLHLLSLEHTFSTYNMEDSIHGTLRYSRLKVRLLIGRHYSDHRS